MKTELLETADSVILRKFLDVALFNCYKSCRQERGGALCVLVLLNTKERQNQREPSIFNSSRAWLQLCKGGYKSKAWKELVRTAISCLKDNPQRCEDSGRKRLKLFNWHNEAESISHLEDYIVLATAAENLNERSTKFAGDTVYVLKFNPDW